MARITRMTKRRLGELLRAEGLITDEQLRAALEEQRKSNLFLGEALVKLAFVSEEVIAATIVQQFNLPFVSAGQFTITPEVLHIFPERMYFEYQFIAVDKIGRTLIIVGAGLMNHDVLDELERLSGCKVCQFVSTWKEIKSTLDSHAKEFQKAQSSELSSLGSMLLDEASPGQKAAATPAPSAKPAGLPSATPAPAAAMPLKPKPPMPPPPPVARPATAAPTARPISPLPPPATPAPMSPKPAVLAGVRPPAKASNSSLVAVPAGAKSGEAPKAPAPQGPPSTGKGLLGLFKKN